MRRDLSLLPRIPVKPAAVAKAVASALEMAGEDAPNYRRCSQSEKFFLLGLFQIEKLVYLEHRTGLLTLDHQLVVE